MLIDKRRATGLWGEIYASRYLRDNGYEIVTANYRSYVGEIDIIAVDGECLCFVEVKTRGRRMLGTPASAVDHEKQKKLSKTAAVFVKSQKWRSPMRFDIIEVYLDDDLSVIKINHIKRAFFSTIIF